MIKDEFSKEKFLTIIDKEMDSLKAAKIVVEKQLKRLESELTDFGKDDPGSIKEKLEYKLSLINKKIEAVKELIYFPLHRRIMFMSDEEVLAYQKSTIEDLEDKIRDIQEEITFLKNKNKIRERSNFDIIRACQYDPQLASINKPQYSKNVTSSADAEVIIFELSAKVIKLKEEIDTIKYKSTKDIRIELLSKYYKEKNASYEVEGQKTELLPMRSIYTSNSNSSKKEMSELEQLVLEYYEESLKQQKERIWIDVSKMPKSFISILHTYGGVDKSLEPQYGVSDPRHMITISREGMVQAIENYERRISEAKATFINNYLRLSSAGGTFNSIFEYYRELKQNGDLLAIWSDKAAEAVGGYYAVRYDFLLDRLGLLDVSYDISEQDKFDYSSLAYKVGLYSTEILKLNKKLIKTRKTQEAIHDYYVILNQVIIEMYELYFKNIFNRTTMFDTRGNVGKVLEEGKTVKDFIDFREMLPKIEEAIKKDEEIFKDTQGKVELCIKAYDEINSKHEEKKRELFEKIEKLMPVANRNDPMLAVENHHETNADDITEDYITAYRSQLIKAIDALAGDSAIKKQKELTQEPDESGMPQRRI